MITLVEALNYRCLRYVRQRLDRFHVLVGPNASGKTTLLDVVSFLGRLVSDGLQEAIRERSPNPQDLLFGRQGKGFELAVEAAIPRKRFSEVPSEYTQIRYEVRIGIDQATAEPSIESEMLSFKGQDDRDSGKTSQRTLFPELPSLPNTIFQRSRRAGRKAILSKSRESGKDNFYPEFKRGPGSGGWVPSFQLGPRRSAFANLPEDESRFPVSSWFKSFLSDAIQQIVLDSLTMRLASPPGSPRIFRMDGSNLPWVVEDLKQNHSQQFHDWIDHLQMALPDLVGIRTFERQDDKHRYLMAQYQGGLEVPSWTTSDGTLRLLALTLPAYLPDLSGVFLIEEPENGIHPRAVETMYQSLSNVYDAQVLLATHSPVILSMVEPNQVLCFAKDRSGATDIVRGDLHPSLLDWQRDTNLGSLFAAGVLG
jgi:predicted ATPase